MVMDGKGKKHFKSVWVGEIWAQNPIFQKYIFTYLWNYYSWLDHRPLILLLWTLRVYTSIGISFLFAEGISLLPTSAFKKESEWYLHSIV